MHTKETPNHHVRGAINHLPLNIKRATECPVGKQGFWKYCFPSPSPHCNKLCFYFGRGWGRARGLRNTVTNDIRFVPQAWLMPDCMHWSLPSQPSAHLLLLPKLIPWCPEKPYRQQRRDHLNVATFYPSKMQVYKNQKLEKWDSQLIWQQACLLWSYQSPKGHPGKTARSFPHPLALSGTQKDPYNSPDHIVKSHSSWKKPLYFQTVTSQKVSPERLYSDCKCCRLFLQLLNSEQLDWGK